ncbi:MAG: radical SAM protein [Lachnospiraceae bacterium]|nr:radical SAM protein [Lachnospiraceae bacterium]
MSDLALLDPAGDPASYTDALMKYASREVSGFLIPATVSFTSAVLARFLRKFKVPYEDIYYRHMYDPGLVTNWISRRELPYIEYQVADGCNMRCSACSHYSQLVKGAVLSDLEETKKGFMLLKDYFENVCLIRVMGGEPLMNPDLHRYIRMTHEIFPKAELEVVSNGILITSMPQDLIDTMKELNVTLYMSYYPAMEGKAEKIDRFLAENGIGHKISVMAKEFSKVTDLSGNLDPEAEFSNCSWRFCTMLRDTRLAVCAYPFLSHYFNEYYGEDLPESGAIDLTEEGLTSEEILKRLEMPVEFCSYCRQPGVPVAWKRAGAEVPMEDIVV